MQILINSDIMHIGLTHYLILAAILFSISICGIFLNNKNMIAILMSIELMLLSVNINFVAFSSYMKDLHGQIFSLLILVVAAAEAAIGLAIIVIHYKNTMSIALTEINKLKG